MNIVACPTDNGGCGWYRIVLPFSNVQGHTVSFTQFKNDPKLNLAELVVENRPVSNNNLEVCIKSKQMGKKLWVDFDDNLHTLPSSNPCADMYGNGKPHIINFERALKLADVVTCSSHILAAEYKKYRDDIIVLPNMLSTEHFDRFFPNNITGEPKREGEIRIGYVASQTHVVDLVTIVKALTNIAKKYDHVKFVFFGQLPPLVPEICKKVEYHEGIAPKDEEPADFMARLYECSQKLDLDIGIAPLARHVFCKCKSYVKVLEYGMLGIPVLATNYGAYQYYKESWGGIQTASPDDTKDWTNKLSELIESASLRAQLASQNIEIVNDYHLITRGISQWQTIVEALTGR